MSSPFFCVVTARAGARRFGPLSALRAHTKAPYKTDFNRKTLRELHRPGTARTVARVHQRLRHRVPCPTYAVGGEATQTPLGVFHCGCGDYPDLQNILSGV
jgi:hypothetical protein